MHIAQFKATTTNRVAIYFLIVGPLVVLACFQSFTDLFYAYRCESVKEWTGIRGINRV